MTATVSVFAVILLPQSRRPEATACTCAHRGANEANRSSTIVRARNTMSSATAPIYEQPRRRATKRTSQPHLTEPERPAPWWLPSAGAPVRHHGPSDALSLPCRPMRAQPTTCENFLYCYQEGVVNQLFGHCAIPQPWRGLEN
jgi:hypothetical protein